MTGFMTSAVVSAHLDRLAQANPATCTRSQAADWAPGRLGGKSGYVKIGATVPASPAQRSAVLLIGGQHAKELAPPDALVSFLEKMLAAYTASTAITYPAWTDPVNSITYDSFVIPWPWVKSVVERLDLYVAPLVNDDGRDFVLTPLPASATPDEQSLHKTWRKNRRPAPSGNTNPRAVGVDLNRNYDIVWKFDKFYNTSLANAAIHASTNPVAENYIGDQVETEPETKNVASLMRAKGISWFIDFHAFGRDVMFSWGIETNQSTDATMNFANPAFDGKRDGVANPGYKEYIPTIDAATGQGMANRIRDEILAKAGGADPKAQARSRYTVQQSADMYVAPGTSQDYCFSRWFTAATAGHPIPTVMAFVIEIGGDPRLGADHDEGGFIPDYVKHFPKLEREIHVAAWAFLSAVASMRAQPPSIPDPPAPQPPPVSPTSSTGAGCLVMLVSCLLLVASVVSVVLGAAGLSALLGGGALAGYLARRRS
jgi:murein tripeptide amidase MpaA